MYTSGGDTPYVARVYKPARVRRRNSAVYTRVTTYTYVRNAYTRLRVTHACSRVTSCVLSTVCIRTRWLTYRPYFASGIQRRAGYCFWQRSMWSVRWSSAWKTRLDSPCCIICSAKPKEVRPIRLLLLRISPCLVLSVSLSLSSHCLRVTILYINVFSILNSRRLVQLREESRKEYVYFRIWQCAEFFFYVFIKFKS